MRMKGEREKGVLYGMESLGKWIGGEGKGGSKEGRKQGRKKGRREEKKMVVYEFEKERKYENRI